MENLQDIIKLDHIFSPSAALKRQQLRSYGMDFVHYTSAENALNIIRNKCIWMRNAKCMNDYMEMSHGHQCLTRIFGNDIFKKSFLEALSKVGGGIADQAFNLFDRWWGNLQHNTYICSISEHDLDESQYGRLSMWRAYGRASAKAAIVLSLPLSPATSDAVNVVVSPVHYFTNEEIEKEFSVILLNINSNIDYLKSLERTFVVNYILRILISYAICLKHPVFKEEKEWRAIYLPQIYHSEYLKSSIEVIDGIPQMIYKIPLENSIEKGVSGLSIPEIVKSVIVGPSSYPMAMYDAFSNCLKEAGDVGHESKVITSNIPLRT